MLVDSHCHLNFPDFTGKINQVIELANENKVNYLQTICTKISEFNEVLKIANDYQNIFCSVGVHPNNVDEADIVSAKQIIDLAQHKKVIGIGETGLDYYYEKSAKDLQKQSFVNHIHAAQENSLPVIIHTRDADEDTIKILENEKKKADFKALIHCFSTSEKLALSCIEMGLYISISGIVTFKNAQDIRNTVKKLPLNRLLVETDSPYLAPVPFRGKTNQPAYTKETAKYIAQMLDIDFDEFCNQTTENFFTLFDKAKK